MFFLQKLLNIFITYITIRNFFLDCGNSKLIFDISGYCEQNAHNGMYAFHSMNISSNTQPARLASHKIRLHGPASIDFDIASAAQNAMRCCFPEKNVM